MRFTISGLRAGGAISETRPDVAPRPQILAMHLGKFRSSREISLAELFPQSGYGPRLMVLPSSVSRFISDLVATEAREETLADFSTDGKGPTFVICPALIERLMLAESGHPALFAAGNLSVSDPVLTSHYTSVY